MICIHHSCHLNCIIFLEYDNYLEKHKEELLSKQVSDGQSQEEYEKEEDEIERVDQEVRSVPGSPHVP